METTNCSSPNASKIQAARKSELDAKFAAIQAFCQDRSDENRNSMFVTKWSVMATSN